MPFCLFHSTRLIERWTLRKQTLFNNPPKRVWWTLVRYTKRRKLENVIHLQNLSKQCVIWHTRVWTGKNQRESACSSYFLLQCCQCGVTDTSFHHLSFYTRQRMLSFSPSTPMTALLHSAAFHYLLYTACTNYQLLTEAVRASPENNCIFILTKWRDVIYG